MTLMLLFCLYNNIRVLKKTDGSCYNTNMLVNGSSLLGRPVLSLHIGGAIGEVRSMIVDPNDLKIVAFELAGPLIKPGDAKLLETASVREFSKLGMIVDSSDELLQQDEVMALDKIMQLNFKVEGLVVESEKGTKLGKVTDFTVDVVDFRVMQLIVKRPILKALLDSELLINRAEIVEVTDTKIIVKDEAAKSDKKQEETEFVPNFINPFRGQNLASKQNLSPVRNQSPDEQDIE